MYTLSHVFAAARPTLIFLLLFAYLIKDYTFGAQLEREQLLLSKMAITVLGSQNKPHGSLQSVPSKSLRSLPSAEIHLQRKEARITVVLRERLRGTCCLGTS